MPCTFRALSAAVCAPSKNSLVCAERTVAPCTIDLELAYYALPLQEAGALILTSSSHIPAFP